MDITQELKTCIKCKEELPIHLFYQQKFFTGKKDGYDRKTYYKGKCKMCYSVDRRIKGY
jgi:hypothetical protein